MSLDLEKQLVFYGAYHHNGVNIAIHEFCVPILLFTGYELVSNTGPLIPLPAWAIIPYLEPNLGTIGGLAYAALYVLLEPVAGLALGVLCVAGAAGANYLRGAYGVGPVNAVCGAVHALCWLLQFVGHGRFEGRAPALVDNLVQAIFLAPLFVWLELLFALGYRPALRARVDRAVKAEIGKFRSAKQVGQGAAAAAPAADRKKAQ